MRAAMSAWSVSGTRSAPIARPALEEHADRLLDEERIPLGPLERLPGQRHGSFAGRPGELVEQLLDELRALVLREGLEFDRGRAHATAAPAGTRVEELGSRQAQDEHRRAHPVREVLDEIEERRFRPVDVLEEKDERLHVRDPLHDLACRPCDLLRAALALERLHETCGEPEDVGDGLLGTALAQLLERLLERVVVRDAGRSLDHLAERPVRHALSVGQRTADEHARPLDPVEELTGEPALPHARLPVDREEVRATVAQTSVERVLEQLELGVAADERSTRADRATGAFEHVHDPPRSQVPVDALELERARILDDEASSSEPVRGRPDEDLAGTSGLLEPRREVHRLARRERRLRAVDDDLARLDSDASLELELVDRGANRERRADGAVGIVLMRLRHAERRHHRVAGELLDDPAVLVDAVRDGFEEPRDAAAHDLRVDPGHEPRRVDDIDEQHRCELSLHV